MGVVVFGRDHGFFTRGEETPEAVVRVCFLRSRLDGLGKGLLALSEEGLHRELMFGSGTADGGDAAVWVVVFLAVTVAVEEGACGEGSSLG